MPAYELYRLQDGIRVEKVYFRIQGVGACDIGCIPVAAARDEHLDVSKLGINKS